MRIGQNGFTLQAAGAIVEDSAGSKWAVKECNDSALSHVWYGIQVKNSNGFYATKAKARKTLVRKEMCLVGVPLTSAQVAAFGL